MPAALACLTGVPHEILEQIVDHADQPKLWRMMGTCSRLRSAAMAVLHPMLVEQRVTANQPFMIDRYNAISPIESEDAMRERLVETCNASDRFHQLAAVYPPAARLLSRLVVEIRDDDAFAGWTQLQRYGPQLASLEIHIIDRFWRPLTGYADREDELSAANSILHEDMLSWKRVTQGGETRFLNVTSLTITGSARAFDHFRHLSPSVPNLRDLTIGTFWTDTDYYPEPPDYRSFVSPNHIRTLTVIGGSASILRILHRMYYRYLILQLLESPDSFPVYLNDGSTLDFRLDILAETVVQSPLSGFALYGPRVWEVLRAMKEAEARHVTRGKISVRQLACLALEVIETGPSEAIAYPLLDNERQLALPAIKRVIWVDRRKAENGSPLLASVNPTKDLAIDQLFERYPTLQLVMWTTEYPIDPFGDEDPLTWSKRDIRACVYRNEDDDKSSPLRVYLSSGE